MSKGKLGRPVSWEKTTAQKIVKYLLERGGATHGEMMERADKPSKISHRVLDYALRSLNKAGIFVFRVEEREGRRAILYAIKDPLLSLLVTKMPGVHSSLRSWIEKTIDHMEKQLGVKPGENSGSCKFTIEEAQDLLYEQCEAGSDSIIWLRAIIHDVVVETNGKSEDDEPRRFLDATCYASISVLVLELVFIASSLYVMREHRRDVQGENLALDANHLSFYIPGVWPPSEDLDEKRGNEPA